MKNQTFFALFALGLFCGTTAFGGVASLNSDTNIRPISQYGIIQNVQNYSTNPFWTSNSPYNQRFPQPVYVKGPELDSSDCQSAVGTLIASYCSSNNNCSGMQLSDVRPLVMLQLSRMPGHNYATACSGYIDSEFDSYIEKNSVALPYGTVSFPAATVANPEFNAPEFKIENPYERKDGTWNGEEWQKEKKERIQELKDLQAKNGSGPIELTKTEFPQTFADLSFTERKDILAEGYEPWANTSAYKPITIEDEDQYKDRLKKNNLRAYCMRYPSDSGCRQQITNSNYNDSQMASLIEKIAAALKGA